MFVNKRSRQSIFGLKPLRKENVFPISSVLISKIVIITFLRYRKSKSFMTNVYEIFHQTRSTFFEVCSWTSFGNDANWKYQVSSFWIHHLLIECPFTGMWTLQTSGSTQFFDSNTCSRWCHSHVHVIMVGISPVIQNIWFHNGQFVVIKQKSMLADREYCRQLDPYGKHRLVSMNNQIIFINVQDIGEKILVR